jgi:hypothetical protein
MRAHVLRNGMKTGTLSPKNDGTMKQNVNFLLAATVRTRIINAQGCIKYNIET